MFIVDSLLGNFDRHNGNGGFLINTLENKARIASVYDCGSCIYPQIDETEYISEIQKTFYKQMIKLRKEIIIDKNVKKG